MWKYQKQQIGMKQNKTKEKNNIKEKGNDKNNKAFDDSSIFIRNLFYII